MNAAQRRMTIYQILEEQGAVEVSALSERLGVSTMTIRRDLSLFEKQGLVRTTYGGACLLDSAGAELSFALKQGAMNAAKEAIGAEAARMAAGCSSAVLDCGTTTLQAARFLAGRAMTLITSSWPAVRYLQNSPKLRLLLAPGIYSETSAGVTGGLTIDFYRRIHADLVLMSTQGFSPAAGATVPDAADAAVKEAILQSGAKKVLLLDHTKIGKQYLISFARAGEFDAIITDDGADPDALRQLRQCCPQVIVAAAPSDPDKKELSSDEMEDHIQL